MLKKNEIKSYHQGQFIRISWRTRKGCQAWADLVVTVTTPNRHNSNVFELVCLVHPFLPDCWVEIYGPQAQRGETYQNVLKLELCDHHVCIIVDRGQDCSAHLVGMGPGPELEQGEGRPGWWWAWPDEGWSVAAWTVLGPLLLPWSGQPVPHSEAGSLNAAGQKAGDLSGYRCFHNLFINHR